MKKLFKVVFTFYAALAFIPIAASTQTNKETFLWVASAINSYSWEGAYAACKSANQADYVKRVRVAADTNLLEITYKVETSFIDGTSSTIETQNNFRNLVYAEICTKCLSCGTDVPIKLGFKKGTMKVLKVEGTPTVPDVMFLFLRWDAETDLKDKMLKSLNQLIKVE